MVDSYKSKLNRNTLTALWSVFLLLWIKVSSEAKKQPESRLRASQGHPVRSDFPIVKTQVVFFREKSPPLAVTRHS